MAEMVTLRVPVRAPELTVKVTTELPAPGAAIVEGLKPTVTPDS